MAGEGKVSAARGVAVAALPAGGDAALGAGWRRASPGEAPSAAIFKGSKGSEESSRVTSFRGGPGRLRGSARSRRDPPGAVGTGAVAAWALAEAR